MDLCDTILYFACGGVELTNKSILRMFDHIVEKRECCGLCELCISHHNEFLSVLVDLLQESLHLANSCIYLDSQAFLFGCCSRGLNHAVQVKGYVIEKAGWHLALYIKFKQAYPGYAFIHQHGRIDRDIVLDVG